MPNTHLQDLAVYACSTQTFMFAMKIFRDKDAEEFVARFGASRLRQQGEAPTITEIIEHEELRDADYESLLERCESRMTELGGACDMYLIHVYPGALGFRGIRRAILKNG
jgi:hypothetical protein